MLETIREYAQRELEREGEADAAGTRHTAFFADLAATLDAPSTYAVSDEQRDLYVSDRANFDEAHANALATGDGASALRFVRRLGRVTGGRGQRPRLVRQGCREHRLARGTREDRAWALVRTARAANFDGRIRSSSELARRSRRPVRRTRGRARERRRNRGASRIELSTGNYDQAVELAEQLVALTQSLEEADPAAAAARTRTPSEGQDVLAYALLGRALEEDDRAAAERSLAFFAARADAPAGTLVEQASRLRD